MTEAFLAANRLTWDERVPIHRRNRTGFYAIDAFKAGGDILHPIEAAEIGEVAGRRLLHLQCHFGLDTLALARRGAVVTGLDFSAPAIEAARALAAETGLAATFVEADVYDAPARLSGPFDVVYSTWGVLCWLPDLRRWAAVVARLLAPGGILYLADMHPLAAMLEEEDGRLVFRHPWRTPPASPLVFDDPTTYTGDPDVLTHRRQYEWIHPLSAILGGLRQAGLGLDILNEHEALPWPALPMMVEAGGRLWRLPPDHPPLPLAFSLKASKPS